MDEINEQTPLEINEQTHLEIRLVEIRNKREYYESRGSVDDDDDSGHLDREYNNICDEEIRINVFLWLERKLLLRRRARVNAQITVSP
jgi:hypothetical protein